MRTFEILVDKLKISKNAKIISTITVEEKEKIKKLTLQFLVRHDYFGKV